MTLNDVDFDREPTLRSLTPTVVASAEDGELGDVIGPLLTRPGGLRDGSTFILSLEDVRAHMGDRWNSVRERLYQAIENAVQELIEASDAFIRVGVHRYLLAFNRGGAVNSGARAAVIARKVKEKLFGVTSPVAVKVFPFGKEEDPDAPQTDTPAAPFEALLGKTAALAKPVVRAPAHTEECQYTFLPIWDAVHKVLSTYVCVPVQTTRSGRTLTGHGILSPEATEIEHAEFDVRTLDYLLEVADELHRNQFAVLISAAINYRSLGTSKSRQILLSACHKISKPLRNFITCELADVPAAVPTSTLAERIGLVRPFFRSVLMEIPALDEQFSRLSYLGLHGVSYHAWRHSPTSSLDMAQVRRAILEAKRARLQVGFGGVRTKAAAHQLVEAGATYLSGPFIGDVLDMPGNMQRCTLDELGQSPTPDVKSH